MKGIPQELKYNAAIGVTREESSMNHQMGGMQEMHLAKVLDNQDPDTRGRIQVQLQSTGMELWAACLTNSAGQGYGMSCLPKVEEIVVVAFISPEVAIVMGAIWSGSGGHPGDAQEVEDKYSLISPQGTKVTLDDGEGPKFKVETSSGNHLTITEEAGGEIVIEKGGESITLSSSGVSIVSSAKVEIQASQVNVSAGMVQVDAGMSSFSGVVKCDTLIATSVISASYTPGAGNIW